ncbi:glycosyltransferase family 2 protein [Chryseobacterium jejuense]|uniref:Glycosyl transferase family 2 n=1 Tax=Chryseobacterium jejuense TaxID=445960 RepID=A0A2X2XA54_CHRJE|nr:glycosyltransferase family A protein [Chryseobacterium jejuense]SDI57159.1 Glycosyl transferase family 2 [Chryseobacterium jejuense]SQB47073.1 Glycosyl transferase family 2 [Chryseobacterium jejuense]
MTTQSHQNKLAIVIPYYKIDFFEETIKSVAKQRNKNFSLYIGNDASPNDPLPIIQKYFEADDYHYFDYKKNIGGQNLALQWERILENVQEEWFQILGDDDMISENFTEEFYQNLPLVEDKKISVIKFSHQWIDEKNQVIENFDYNFSELKPSDFFIKKYTQEIRSSLSENIFKFDSYQRIGFQKITLAWGSDDLAILLFSQGNNILYTKNSKVKVRISESSISGSDHLDDQKLKAHFELREILVTKYSSLFDYQFIANVVEEYLSSSNYNTYNAHCSVIFFYLKHFKIKAFLKALKKIYYIKRKWRLKFPS